MKSLKLFSLTLFAALTCAQLHAGIFSRMPRAAAALSRSIHTNSFGQAVAKRLGNNFYQRKTAPGFVIDLHLYDNAFLFLAKSSLCPKHNFVNPQTVVSTTNNNLLITQESCSNGCAQLTTTGGRGLTMDVSDNTVTYTQRQHPFTSYHFLVTEKLNNNALTLKYELQSVKEKEPVKEENQKDDVVTKDAQQDKPGFYDKAKNWFSKIK